jgi:YbbR domain-containing protein
MLLSLILATLVWVTAVREQNPPREDDYNRSIPIQVISPAPGLVTIDSLPELVRVRLLAPQSSWDALTPTKFKATVDLSKLPAGFNDVPIEVVVSDPEVEIVSQIPQVVTVNLQVEQSITMPIKVEVLDTPPLGYVGRTPVTLPTTVTVTGPASLIGQVAEAITEIAIDNSKETVEHTRPVLVRDREGRPMGGLIISPAKAQVTLPIEQRFGYKDVSVSAVVEGQVAPGYWISNMSVNPQRLVVVGNPDVLDLISGFIETVPINVDQATEDIVQITPLNLPDGVTIVLPGGETTGASGVEVTIEVTTIESGQTVQRPIVQQGIDPNYTWTASPERADVILSGPIPRLQALKPEDTKVIVDLFGLEPGVHQVRPTVFLPDGLRVEAILPDTIEVRITLASTPTPTSTPTSTLTGTRTLSTTQTPTPRQTSPVR